MYDWYLVPVELTEHRWKAKQSLWIWHTTFKTEVLITVWVNKSLCVNKKHQKKTWTFLSSVTWVGILGDIYILFYSYCPCPCNSPLGTFTFLRPCSTRGETPHNSRMHKALDRAKNWSGIPTRLPDVGQNSPFGEEDFSGKCTSLLQ